MKEIKLTRGQVALVDDADYLWLSKFNWVASKMRTGKWRATRMVRVSEKGDPFFGNKTNILMHTVIMRTPAGMEVDHIDGNSLNNQRSNLRLATSAQNKHNRAGWTGSGFKGVHKAPKGKFTAVVTVGVFDTAEEAARAYDKAAAMIHGEFAWLNYPTEERK